MFDARIIVSKLKGWPGSENQPETKMNAEQLIKIGGKEWKAGQKHRIYFHDLAMLFGLYCSMYKTGNISSATLNGEKISNSKATKLLYALRLSKVWFDVNTNAFHYECFPCDKWTGEQIGDAIVEEIKRRLP